MANNIGSSPSLRGAVDLSALLRKNDAPRTAASESGLSREFDDRSVGELVELSHKIPVVTEIYGGNLTPQLQAVVESYGGRFLYGSIQAESAPELIRALQIQGIPVVLAFVGGQPLPLFQGIPPEQDVRTVLDQVLALAAKNGVTGTVSPSDGVEDDEPPLPPLHQEAFDALSRNDIDGARQAYQKALQENPKDSDAEAGLAQVDLLGRVRGVDAAAARAAAAATPTSVEAALVVADVDVAGGHLADAFRRLLALYPDADETEKELLRARLLSYFVVAGPGVDEVKAARTQLANLMF